MNPGIVFFNWKKEQTTSTVFTISKKRVFAKLKTRNNKEDAKHNYTFSRKAQI